MRLFIVFQCMVLWVALVPGRGWDELAIGVLVGLVALLLFGPMFKGVREERKDAGTGAGVLVRAWSVLVAIGLFIWDVTLSAFRLAALILGKKPVLSIVTSYPLTIQSPLAVTVLSSLITLTPGTLTVDYSPTGKMLHIHCLTGEGDTDPLKRVRKLEKVIGRALNC